MLSHLVKAVPALERTSRVLFSGLRIFRVIIKVPPLQYSLQVSIYQKSIVSYFLNLYCCKCLKNKAHGLN